MKFVITPKRYYQISIGAFVVAVIGLAIMSYVSEVVGEVLVFAALAVIVIQIFFWKPRRPKG